MLPNIQFLAHLVTITEEILNGNFIFSVVIFDGKIHACKISPEKLSKMKASKITAGHYSILTECAFNNRKNKYNN